MVNKLVQQILSKLFPYDRAEVIEVYTTDGMWAKQKFRENEEFYCGQDGTGRY